MTDKSLNGEHFAAEHFRARVMAARNRKETDTGWPGYQSLTVAALEILLESDEHFAILQETRADLADSTIRLKNAYAQLADYQDLKEALEFLWEKNYDLICYSKQTKTIAIAIETENPPYEMTEREYPVLGGDIVTALIRAVKELGEGNNESN